MANVSAQLVNMLSALDQVDLMLNEFERTGDKRVHYAITKEMKSITSQFKDLSSNPECRTKENVHKLFEMSNRVKEAVEKTKSLSVKVAGGTPNGNNGGTSEKGNDSVVAQRSPLASPRKPNPTALNLMGYLRKQGQKGPVRSWKKRWFQQRDSKILYFKSENDVSPQGYIDLQQASAVEVKDGNVFELATPARTFVLQALKESDFSYWVDGLRGYLTSLHPPPVTPTSTASPRPSRAKVAASVHSPARRSLNFDSVTPTASSPGGAAPNRKSLSVHEETIEAYRKNSILEQKVADLEEKLNSSNEVLHEQTQMNIILEQRVLKLSDVLKKQEEELAHLRGSSAAKLEEELRNKEKQVDGLKMAKIKLEETNKLLEEKNKDLSDVLVLLRAEMVSKEKTIHELHNQLLDNTGHDSQSLQARLRSPPTSPRTYTEIDRLKEAVQAHQTQNRFLSSEIQRLELETRVLAEAKEESVAALQRTLEEARIQFQNLRTIVVGSSNSEEYLQALEKENLNVKKEYFLALAVSVKLNRSLEGKLSNLDVISLYEKAISENIPFKSWPNFISKQICPDIVDNGSSSSFRSINSYYSNSNSNISSNGGSNGGSNGSSAGTSPHAHER